MKKLSCSICSLASALLVLAAVSTYAQPSDTIMANPDAVKLHRIWTMTGSPITLDQVGDGIGPVGDINGDALEDFAVHVGRTGQWRVFYGHEGAPDTATAWTFDSSGAVPAYPVVGDFWGTGHKAVGFGRYRWNASHTARFYQHYIFRSELGRLADSAAAVFDPQRTMTPPAWISLGDVTAADLDDDGADELIVTIPSQSRFGETRHAEIWIYKGGPNFQVDSPTVIIRDPEENSDESKFFTAIGDFDGDQRPDILIAGFYGSAGAKLKLWFSSQSSPESWAGTDSLSRAIPLSTLGHPRIGYGLTTLDCDGDGVLDLMLPGPDGHVYLYRTHATGTSARTRSFDLADADQRFYRDQSTVPTALGYVSDSAHRYQMAGLFGPSPSGRSAMLMGLSGGPGGADNLYDAFYAADLDGLGSGDVFGNSSPAMADCNGDGWDDLLTGNFRWGGNEGIALVLAGGPYIPRDPASGVQQISTEERSNAISTWPNPVHEELNIAWRGDLRHMPRSFAVYDMLGQEIARGDVPGGSGAARWHCAEVPAGVYLLSVYDEHGDPIATARIVKQ